MQKQESPYDTPESDISSPTSNVVSRRELIPLWIKIFGWIFIAMTFMSIPMMIWAAIAGEVVSFQLFGFTYAGPALDPGAFFLLALYMFMAITAYGLLFGRDWGLTGAMANGYVGIALCVITMILSGGTAIRAEPIVQLFYLRRLYAIKDQWRASIRD